jgi:hypothetical protein
MGRREMNNTLLMGKPKEKSYREELKVDGNVILRWLLDR